MHKILLVEDDKSLGYILSEYLLMQDFIVDWVKTGEDSLIKLQSHIYDLVILDIMLPGIDGYEVAAEIKSRFVDTPFIFLSAMSLKIDKLKGYKIGAYDFVSKPIEEEVLVAKIKAIIKQTQSSVMNQKVIIRIGQFDFDSSLNLLHQGIKVTKLTKRESELLKLFCEYKGRLLERDVALRKIWNSTDEFSRKSMDVFISHLRKYLEADASIRIDNIHGKGFVFSVDE